MKKTLSLVLATVLAFGSAVSAFAAWPTTDPASAAKLTNNLIYTYNSDEGYFEPTTSSTIKKAYGKTFGFIVTEGTGINATDSDHVKNLKAYPEYKVPNNKDLVEKVAVEFKKFSADAGVTSSYAYFVTMKTKANSTATSADLFGEMRIAKSSTAAKAQTSGYATFNITLENNKQNSASSYTVTSSAAVLDFKDQTEISVDFNGKALFDVDATGQSKLNVGFTTKFNSEFAAKYPEANLNFITWGANPSFNRIGELQIYAEPDTYLYQLTDDGFKEVSAKYDPDYEAFVLKTRTLGAYVVSDIELEAEVIDETPVVPGTPGTNPGTGGGVIEVPNNGGKPNPNTGR